MGKMKEKFLEDQEKAINDTGFEMPRINNLSIECLIDWSYIY